MCKNLKQVMLNDGLEVLGKDEHPDGEELCGVFEGSAIENMKLPSTLKRIEYRAFKNCKGLKRVNLPENIEHIGRQCF